MSKRWTSDEDAFLLEHHGAVGADFLASHDLGRPDGAGSRRLAALTKSGARLAFARMRKARAEFDYCAGRFRDEYADEMDRWEREENDALSAMASQ